MTEAKPPQSEGEVELCTDPWHTGDAGLIERLDALLERGVSPQGDPPTPGEWFVEDDGDLQISSTHGQIIARVFTSGDFPCLEEGTADHMDAEARANAALIVELKKAWPQLRTALSSRTEEVERLRGEIAEMKSEQELFDRDLGEKQRMLDRLADLLKIPHDVEIDQTAIELFYNRVMVAESSRDTAWNEALAAAASDCEGEAAAYRMGASVSDGSAPGWTSAIILDRAADRIRKLSVPVEPHTEGHAQKEILRLQSELAAAEAERDMLQKDNASLRDLTHAPDGVTFRRMTFEQAEKRGDAEAERDRMREALEPFAELANWYAAQENDGHMVWKDGHEIMLTVGDLRKARAALTHGGEG